MEEVSDAFFHIAKGLEEVSAAYAYCGLGLLRLLPIAAFAY